MVTVNHHGGTVEEEQQTELLPIRWKYMLRLTTSNPVLNVSYIGFKTQTVEVRNRSVINIVLEEETSFR